MYTFEQGANQLLSVSTICANPSATRVLLIVWLVFAGCCLAMLALYVCWQRWLIKQSGSLKRFLPLFAALQTMYSMFSGLGGLAFYYYDLVSNIVVLAQVWSKWPASVLLAIFLFHFAMTGAIVAFHGFYRLVGLKYDLSATGPRFVTCVVIVSLLGSPFMIPVVLLLDTCTATHMCFHKTGFEVPSTHCAAAFVSLFTPRILSCFQGSSLLAFI